MTFIMFTGITQATALVTSLNHNRLEIKLPIAVIKRPQIGESISIDGVCLTVISIKKTINTVKLCFTVAEETIKITTISLLKKNSKVNIERAPNSKTLFGGHMMYGHVDAKGRVISNQDKYLKISFPKSCNNLLTPKGSIAINGISLTIATLDLKKNQFSVNLIPHTMATTNLSLLAKKDYVNLEFDLLNKYFATHFLKSTLVSHRATKATKSEQKGRKK